MAKTEPETDTQTYSQPWQPSQTHEVINAVHWAPCCQSSSLGQLPLSGCAADFLHECLHLPELVHHRLVGQEADVLDVVVGLGRRRALWCLRGLPGVDALEDAKPTATHGGDTGNQGHQDK